MVGAGGAAVGPGWHKGGTRRRRCHGGVRTAAAPLAAGTSGSTAGTLPQLDPGHPLPCPAIAVRDAVTLPGGKGTKCQIPAACRGRGDNSGAAPEPMAPFPS